MQLPGNFNYASLCCMGERHMFGYYRDEHIRRNKLSPIKISKLFLFELEWLQNRTNHVLRWSFPQRCPIVPCCLSKHSQLWSTSLEKVWPVQNPWEMILARLEGQEIAVDIRSRFQLAASQDLVEQSSLLFRASKFWVPLPGSKRTIFIMSAQIINHKATLLQRLKLYTD